MFVTHAFGQPWTGFEISPQRTCSSSWMNVHDNVFDCMLSPELASNSFMQRPSHCCGASATQDREMAYKLKEIKHREAMKRQAELEKKERRFKEQRRRHKTKTRLHFTVLDDSSPRYLAVGARMNTEGIGAENVEIRGKNGQLTITVSKSVPMYRHVRDIFGNVALQRCGTKTEKAWSETVDVDPSLDVEHVSARLYDNMLVMQLPYKKEEKSKEVLIESSREDDAPSTRSEPEAQAKEETQTTHEEQDASDGIQIHIEDSPRTSDKDIWEKLDGSIEDCEYE